MVYKLSGTLPLSFLSCHRGWGFSAHLHWFHNLTSLEFDFIFHILKYIFDFISLNILQSCDKFSTFDFYSARVNIKWFRMHQKMF